MSGLVSSLSVGALLLLFLLLLWRKAEVSARERPHWNSLPLDQQLELEACPAEMVSKIFSHEDREFVSGLHCVFLEKLFLAERKALALLWVQQTTHRIRGIMREHVELARRCPDLEFRTEAKIFLRYAGIRMICSFLFLSIELAGPFWVRGLAVYASHVSQRIGRSHEAFLATVELNANHGSDSYYR